MVQVFEILFEEDKDMLISDIYYHCSWWTDKTRSKDTKPYGID